MPRLSKNLLWDGKVMTASRKLASIDLDAITI